MKPERALASGALACAIAVAAGALGAHLLRARLDPENLARWETAARYLGIAGLGAIGAALAARTRGDGAPDAAVLVAGGAGFALAVGGLALGGPFWLGALAPFGGLAIISGFVWFAARAGRPPSGR
ncbi:MAG: DUF423 domain-containing protein [Thermoanaerobaculia bacterium]